MPSIFTFESNKTVGDLKIRFSMTMKSSKEYSHYLYSRIFATSYGYLIPIKIKIEKLGLAVPL